MLERWRSQDPLACAAGCHHSMGSSHAERRPPTRPPALPPPHPSAQCTSCAGTRSTCARWATATRRARCAPPSTAKRRSCGAATWPAPQTRHARGGAPQPKGLLLSPFGWAPLLLRTCSAAAPAVPAHPQLSPALHAYVGAYLTSGCTCSALPPPNPHPLQDAFFKQLRAAPDGFSLVAEYFGKASGAQWWGLAALHAMLCMPCGLLPPLCDWAGFDNGPAVPRRWQPIAAPCALSRLFAHVSRRAAGGSWCLCPGCCAPSSRPAQWAQKQPAGLDLQHLLLHPWPFMASPLPCLPHLTPGAGPAEQHERDHWLTDSQGHQQHEEKHRCSPGEYQKHSSNQALTASLQEAHLVDGMKRVQGSGSSSGAGSGLCRRLHCSSEFTG